MNDGQTYRHIFLLIYLYHIVFIAVTLCIKVNSFHAYPFCGIISLYCSLISHENSVSVFFSREKKECVKICFSLHFAVICLFV